MVFPRNWPFWSQFEKCISNNIKCIYTMACQIVVCSVKIVILQLLALDFMIII